MKFLPLISLFCGIVMHVQGAFSQCQSVEKLDFPYEKGLKMGLSGKTVKYDEYNFPLQTQEYNVHYFVKDNQTSAKGNASVFDIDIVVDKDTVSRNYLSDLYISAKGMSWKAQEGKKQETQAILLPLEKGKVWYTHFFGDKKNKMTCITVDSTLTLYLGNVRAFGVMYQSQEGGDERFAYYQEMYEWYNTYLGKVAMQVKRYGVEKNTGRTFLFSTKEVLLAYTNVSKEKIQAALQECK